MDAVLYIQAARDELADRDASSRALANAVLDSDYDDEERGLVERKVLSEVKKLLLTGSHSLLV